MSIALTQRTKLSIGKSVKEPNIVLEIEGVDTIYGAQIIRQVAQVGDPGLVIGDPELNDDAFYVGGLGKVGDQTDAITMDGTTTAIRQMLQIDLGQGSSISTMSIALMDVGDITRLITPGEVIDDILQARCKVYLGFSDVAFPEDYIVIFRGVVTDVMSDAGKVVLTLNHPDDKKQGSIYKNCKPKLDSFRAVGFSVTIASPGLVSATAHGFVEDDIVSLSTDGALPTGLLPATNYYVIYVNANAFNLKATLGGAAINTSGVQSGTHTVTRSMLSSAATSIDIDSIDGMLERVTGPDGSYDPSFISAIRIDDEVIAYTGITGTKLTGCTRGYLGTTAANHEDGADASTFYRLLGSCIDLALKLMLSTGDGSSYLEDLEIDSFEDVEGDAIPNAIYFATENIVAKHNVQIGDYVTISGAANGANNVTLKVIDDIVETANGQYFIISGVTFVSENPTDAVVSFRSQYDTLPDGLALINDEVDIEEHTRLQDLFLSAFEYDFYLKDTITDARKFLEQEVYSPVAAFSIPRKSRCSIGYHIGPLPGQDIKVFDETNVKEPGKMKMTRSTNRQFFNEIVYKFDESVLTDDFLSGIITISELSKAQIRGYNKPLNINSKGLRSSLDGVNTAVSQSNRRLNRYQYGAEVLSFGTLFADGFNLEIGDIVWIDGSELKIPDIKSATKGMAGRYFFVQNKTLNIKTGDVQFDCIDTNFSSNGRYGLMSPSSILVSGESSTDFTIGESYSGKFGGAEHKKWTNLVGATVRVRSDDFSSSELATLVSASSNAIVVAPPLSGTPTAGMIMELAKYDEQTLEAVILVYVCMRDTDFADGKQQFVML